MPQERKRQLGIPADKVRHRHGDADVELPGMASVGSRSAMTAGSATLKSVEATLAKGKTIAATVLAAAEAVRDKHRSNDGPSPDRGTLK